jgi:hypothetical protein
MTRSFVLLFLIVCSNCSNPKSNKTEPIASRKDSVATTKKVDSSLSVRQSKRDSVITVLVLPAYDPIANIGGSPDTQYILEKVLSHHENLQIVPFPLKKLMGVRYQMVYDKKYCTPILDKVVADIVIMSQIITKNEQQPSHWPWSYKVKIYNVGTNLQMESISANNIESDKFITDIKGKTDQLISDIFATFAPN